MKALAALSLALFTIAGAANAITYTVDRTIGDATVTGFLETDGTLGTLATTNFVDWEIQVSSPSFVPLTLMNNTNSTLSVIGSQLSATATDISFNFGGSSGYFYVYLANFGSPDNPLWCMRNGGVCGNGATDFSEYAQNLLQGDGSQLQFQQFSTPQVIASNAVQVVPLPASAVLLGASVSLLFGFSVARNRRRLT